MKTRKLSYFKVFKFCLTISFLILLLTILLNILNRKVVRYTNTNITKVITLSKNDFAIKYIYDDAMPSSADPVTINSNLNYSSREKTIKVGTGAKAVYNGKMTGYGGDCAGCGGNLSCRLKDGTKMNLKTDGQLYTDEIYGQIRIVAADLSLFPCGTIIKIDNGKVAPFYSIVLDTGYTVRKAWSSGIIWLDLAFITEKDETLPSVTTKNAIYSVQRWGW